MYYPEYTIGGELFHSNTATGKAFKYIDKVRTKTGKWRYIYQAKKNKERLLFESEASGHANRYAKNERERKKFERLTNKVNYQTVPTSNIEKAIEEEKELLKQYKQFYEKDKDQKTKEVTRRQIDKLEKDIYDLENELHHRQGNVKLGRQR